MDEDQMKREDIEADDADVEAHQRAPGVHVKANDEAADDDELDGERDAHTKDQHTP